MVLEFIINPQTLKILKGRFHISGDKHLTCSAPVCLHQKRMKEAIIKDDNLNPLLLNVSYGRDILISGYINCPRCNNKIDILNPDLPVVVCPYCNKNDINVKSDKGEWLVTWTQNVFSKHKKNKQKFYHGDCWINMHYGDDDE